MSIQAMAWAKTVQVGDPAKKCVLMNLADYADEHGYCYPSQERIAAECCMAVRTLRNHLQQLEEAGLVVRERRFNEYNGSRTSDGYTLVLTAEPAGRAYRQPEVCPTGNELPGNHQVTTSTKKEARTKRTIPKDWFPNDEHVRIAAERGLDLDAEEDKMRDWASASAAKYADWDAMFRNWLRNAKAPNNGRAANSQPRGAPVASADAEPWEAALQRGAN
jgi:DNA-binding transcriptional ArsR family regulator